MWGFNRNKKSKGREGRKEGRKNKKKRKEQDVRRGSVTPWHGLTSVQSLPALHSENCPPGMPCPWQAKEREEKGEHFVSVKRWLVKVRTERKKQYNDFLRRNYDKGC